MTVNNTARASAWSTIDIVVRQGVGFAVSIVLARLLNPDDFGLIALLAVFGSLPIAFTQMGVSTAIIQDQKTNLDEESSIFWFNILASVAIAALIIAIGPYLAAYHQNAVLQPLMYAVAAQVILSSFGTVHYALLARELRFDQLAKAGLATSLISGGLGIYAALSGAGVWAIALQLTSAIGLNAAMMWIVSDWRPRIRFKPIVPRKLVRFAAHVGAVGALDVLYNQGFALILGKVHGVREVGIYSRAHTTQLFPSAVLSQVIARIIFPLFSSRADDAAALRRGVKLANSLAMLFNTPVMIGLALTADLVIAVLFGNKWIDAVPVLSILAIGGVLFPLQVVNVQLLLAQGQSDRFLRTEVIKKVLGIAFVVVGSFFGILGLAYSQLLFAAAALAFNCWLTREAIDYGLLAQLKDIAGIGVAVTAMGLAVTGMRTLLVMPPHLELMVLIGAGAAVYGAVGFGVRSDAFMSGLGVARDAFRSRKRPNDAREA